MGRRSLNRPARFGPQRAGHGTSNSCRAVMRTVMACLKAQGSGSGDAAPPKSFRPSLTTGKMLRPVFVRRSAARHSCSSRSWCLGTVQVRGIRVSDSSLLRVWAFVKSLPVGPGNSFCDADCDVTALEFA